MITVEWITALFYEVDAQMRTIPTHLEIHLWPSEVVTLGLLQALKGVGNRACSRWLTRDSRPLCPHLLERTRLFCLSLISASTSLECKDDVHWRHPTPRFLTGIQRCRSLSSIASMTCSVIRPSANYARRLLVSTLEPPPVGTQHTQTIARKHIDVRIQRLVRRTMCFSTATILHRLVIGRCIDRSGCGRCGC
jgi:hypothetical protein